MIPRINPQELIMERLWREKFNGYYFNNENIGLMKLAVPSKPPQQIQRQKPLKTFMLIITDIINYIVYSWNRFF